MCVNMWVGQSGVYKWEFLRSLLTPFLKADIRIPEIVCAMSFKYFEMEYLDQLVPEATSYHRTYDVRRRHTARIYTGPDCEYESRCTPNP